MTSRSHITLNIKQKLNLIDDSKKYDKSALCKKYKCSKATINRILKSRDSIVEKSKTIRLSTKRNRSGACLNVEKALTIWFKQMRESGALVSRNIILEKAKKFAVEMGVDFNPSSGWLHRWQKREGIILKKVQGEGASADIDAANAFLDTVLTTLISKYEPSDIFNADESGLFFRALPNSTLSKKGDQKRGFKNSKERLTLLFVCNATGDYKKVIIIGKSKNPRCFKNKVLPLEYYSQHKAWMTQDLWQKFLLSLDAEMGKQRRKIILFVDNASSHKTSANLSNIDLQYLPANTTSIAQPLDQGIIHSFKSYYRQNIIRKQISAIESGKTIGDFTKNLSIFKALHIIKNSWWLVKPSTIANCFNKAKFFSSAEQVDLENDIVELNIDDAHQKEFENFVRCDDNVPCCGTLTEQEIIEEIVYISPSDSSEDEENEDIISPPSTKEALNCLHVLRDFCLAQNYCLHELDDIEKRIIEGLNKSKIQMLMTDFFNHISSS